MKRKPGARNADGESAEERPHNTKRLRLYERGAETIAASAGGGLDIASYFAVRSAKLKDQGGATCSSIFRDCRFYVNTCCENGAQLRHLIHKHGAGVSLGPTVGSLTHIVAENLNASKIDAMVGRAGAKYICVVKPQFIYASVAAGRRLSEREFSAIDDSFQPALVFPKAAGLRGSARPAAGAGGVERRGVERRSHMEECGTAHTGCSKLGSASAGGAQQPQHGAAPAAAAAAASVSDDTKGSSAQSSAASTDTAGGSIRRQVAGECPASADRHDQRRKLPRPISAGATIYDGISGSDTRPPLMSASASASASCVAVRAGGVPHPAAHATRSTGGVTDARPVPQHTKSSARIPAATRSWAKFAGALPDPRLLCAGTVGHQDAYRLQTAALPTASAAGLAGGAAASISAPSAATRPHGGGSGVAGSGLGQHAR